MWATECPRHRNQSIAHMQTQFAFLTLFYGTVGAASPAFAQVTKGDPVDAESKHHHDGILELKDLQLIQRDVGINAADVTVSGEIKDWPAGSVNLWVWQDKAMVHRDTKAIPSSTSVGGFSPYSFEFALDSSLVQYTVTLSFNSASLPDEYVFTRAESVLVGDAYIIYGQSNGQSFITYPNPTAPPSSSNPYGCEPEPTFPQPGQNRQFVRAFGSVSVPELPTSSPSYFNYLRGATDRNWYIAQDDAPLEGGFAGSWPLGFAYRMLATENVPIALINGCVGSSLIWHNKRDPLNPTAPQTNYGRLLRKIQWSGLSNARALFWHQGESHRRPGNEFGPDQTVASYKAHFRDLLSAWSMDLPVLERIFVLQVHTQPQAALRPMQYLQEALRTMNTEDGRIVSIPTSGLNHHHNFDIHFDCAAASRISSRAAAAARTYFADYALPSPPFDPLSPVNLYAVVRSGAPQVIEVDFGTSPNALNWSTSDLEPGIESQFSIVGGVTVSQVKVNNGQLLVYFSGTGRPEEITYHVDHSDQNNHPWMYGPDDSDPFGFTLPVQHH